MSLDLIHITYITIGFVIVYFLIFLERYYKKFIDNDIPGPPPLPFIGNVREIRFDHEGALIYHQMREKYGEVVRYWIGYKLVVILSDPEDAEILFQDTQNLTKSEIYNFLHPWLGTGLLTSTGYKWHVRRKAITPTFHFKVLEQFLDVFDKKSKIFTDCLAKEANGKIFDIYPYVSRLSLDVICETAMGTTVNAQTDLNEPYVDALRRLCNGISERIAHIWYHPNFLFKLFGKEKTQNKLIDTLHGFAKKVMAEQSKKIEEENTDDKNTEEGLGIRKKTAFLELLLRMKAQQNSAFVTEEDVREEVDTFMFEGHDTTASALSFTLHCLGKNPEIQEKAYQEVKEVLEHHEGPITMELCHELKYLERVIKESLRIYPPVPLIAREISNDIDLPSGYRVPAGSIVSVAIGGIHLNQKYYPEPLVFDPDRFLPEKMANRHPYSYVPFSAGPRNCIGQRFVMLELKSALSQFLLKYEIGAGEDTMPGMVLTLQSDNGHQVWLRPRNSSANLNCEQHKSKM